MNLILKILKNPEKIVLVILLMLLLSYTLTSCFIMRYQSIFSELAWSFLHGKLYFINELSNPDLVFFNGHNYWHMPPLPAIIMLPLNFIFQKIIYQGYANLILNLFLFFLIVKFARKKFNFTKLNSYWLATLYLFSTVYINSLLIPLGYYYAQTVATLLIFLSLYEYFGKRRLYLIGTFLGLVFLTRLTAGLVIIFFMLAIIADKTDWQKKIKQIVSLLAPVIICLIILAFYNFLRFGNPLETGYTLTDSYLNEPELHPYGQFSLKYIPQNFYYYFLESFKPIYAPGANTPMTLQPPYVQTNTYGATSFFLISPLFILLFFANYKGLQNKLLLITSSIILLVLLSYYFNGWWQIGPRYLNDCLPLLFLILLNYFQNKSLQFKHKVVIIFSSLFNVYLYLYHLYMNFFNPS